MLDTVSPEEYKKTGRVQSELFQASAMNASPPRETPGGGSLLRRGPAGGPSALPQPLTIRIVDDHPPIQEGLRELLARAPGFAVVGVAGSGAEALERLKGSPPNVVLLDWFLPDTTCPQLIPQILARTPKTKILVYTGQPDEAVTLAALHAGAQGCFSKAEPLEKLLRAIRAVAEGEIWADRHAVGRFFREVRARLPESSDHSPEVLALLTQREREVAWLVAEGNSNKEIAEQLGVSVLTVKTHLRHLLRKLHVANRTQLALRLLPWRNQGAP